MAIASTHYIRTFAQDLLDRRARQRRSGAVLPDVWALVLAIFASVSAFLEGWQRLGTVVLGISATMAGLILSLFGIGWCIHVIRAVEGNGTALVQGLEKPIYRYRSGVRQFCKIGLLVLSLVTPGLVASVTAEMSLLPTMIYGELRDLHNKPLPNISVKIGIGGEDLTGRESLATDSDGFYQVQTIRRVRRTAQLTSVCGQGLVSLPLRREYEGKATRRDMKPATIFFQHQILCEAPK